MNKIDEFYTKDPAQFALSYIDYVASVFKAIDSREIEQFVQTILDARRSGVTLYFIGNGGSASTASHFANDLSFGTHSYDLPFRVFSLTDNQPAITAIANDYGYEEIFSRQLAVYGKEGDVVVGISASGNSPNILSAFSWAKKSGVKTVALTAFDGGKMREVADENVYVPTELKEYGPAEDAHMMLNHLVSAYLLRVIKDNS